MSAETAITCPEGEDCTGMQAWSVIEEPNGVILWCWACDSLGSEGRRYPTLSAALDAAKVAHRSESERSPDLWLTNEAEHLGRVLNRVSNGMNPGLAYAELVSANGARRTHQPSISFAVTPDGQIARGNGSRAER